MNLVPETLKRPGQATILVCGGRDYADVNTLCDFLDHILIECEDRDLRLIIIQGGATGADAIARNWADDNAACGSNIGLITEHANWAVYGRAAGPIRNGHMIDRYGVDIEFCLCTEGGDGTNNMVELCADAGLTVVRVL